MTAEENSDAMDSTPGAQGGAAQPMGQSGELQDLLEENKRLQAALEKESKAKRRRCAVFGGKRS